MVVAFGDSTTAPRTVDKKPLTVYADLLQKELPGKGVDAIVINAGLGGNNTSQAVARLERDVLAYAPSLVVVQFGINDSAVDAWKDPPAKGPRVPIERYEQNLRHVVRTLKSLGARVILMTPNPLRWTDKLKPMYGKPPYDPKAPDGFNVLLCRYAETVRRIAGQEKASLVDVDAAYTTYGKAKGRSEDDLLLDGMHPNAKGHRLIADRLIEEITKMASDGEVGARTWTRSGPGAVLHPDCVEITHDTPHDHVGGVSFARLADGAVITAFSVKKPYGPPGSTWIDQRITRDGGRTWSPPQRVVHHPECQACGPSILLTRKGTIYVFYLGFKRHVWKDGNPTPEDQSDLWTIRSDDGGKTWGHRQRIYEGYTGATNGAIETRTGHLVVPFSHYVSDPGRLVSRTVVSTDGGETWKLSNALDIGGAGDHDGAIEPAVVELKDGRVWMLIRTKRGQFWQSFSTDGGLTWSQAKPTSIAATSAPCHVARLTDGRLVLVWNPKHTARRELRMALSDDEGRHWSAPTVLARGKQVTYPFVMEVEPGQLWVGFHDVHGGWGAIRSKILKLLPGMLKR